MKDYLILATALAPILILLTNCNSFHKTDKSHQQYLLVIHSSQAPQHTLSSLTFHSQSL